MRWSPINDGVVVATSSAYEVALYQDYGIIRILRRSIEPEPATREAAIEEVGDGMRVSFPGGIRVCDPEEVVEQRGLADVIPVIDELAAGPQGSLWVKRSAGPTASGPIDVFRADGTYHGTLPEGSPLPVAVIGDRIAAIETDDSDVQRLVVYRVIR